MATTVAEKIIRIDVVTSAAAQKNIQALAADMKKVEDHTKQIKAHSAAGFGDIATALGRIQGFLGAAGVATGFGALARAVLDSASAYEVLNARLKIVLESEQKAAVATRDIFEIARVTGREVDGVSKLYEKAARAAQQFGIAQEDVRQITVGFSQAIRLSGASTQEAYASLVQFGQALASGRLQGDEFRSLMENNSVFMYELAKAAGVTVGALRKMGTEGKLNAQFLFDTMLKEGKDGLNMLERLEEMAKRMPLTFTQSLQSVKTGLTEFVGESARLLEFKSEDNLGIFGPWIRAITDLTNRVRDLRIESDGMDDGFFERILKFYRELPSLTPGAVLYDKFFRKTPGERVQVGVEDLRKEIVATEENITKLNARVDSYLAKGAEVPRDVSVMLEAQFEKVSKLKDDLSRLSLAQSKIFDNAEPAIEPKLKIKTPTGPSDEEARRLKTARESLDNYVNGLREQRDVAKQVLEGNLENAKWTKLQVDLETALKKAGVGLNSELGKRATALIQEAKGYTEAKEARDANQKSILAELTTMETRSEKVKTQIERDEAAIAAIRNKTKASQEYSTAELQSDRATLVQQMNDLVISMGEADMPLLNSMNTLLTMLDKAIAKRKELEGVQADKRVVDEQVKIDAGNKARVEGYSQQINTALKNAIVNGKTGESLFESIKTALRDKTIDIVINPITSILSRVLAQIADDFGRMISRNLFQSLANQSSDPLGSFISLMGLGGGGSGPLAPVESYPFVPAGGGVGASALGATREISMSATSARAVGTSIAMTNAPTIYVDSRSDAAQVRQIAYEATLEGNQQMVEELRVQGIIA